MKKTGGREEMFRVEKATSSFSAFLDLRAVA